MPDAIDRLLRKRGASALPSDIADRVARLAAAWRDIDAEAQAVDFYDPVTRQDLDGIRAEIERLLVEAGRREARGRFPIGATAIPQG